ncbi:unnamed protein product [Paramecium primaurelia]|uniref:Uncharacterized protein n=1 Tax=Paramecium primaurelia TaxID=5886 RepID=A0A8S1QPB0_PARPR|nr:unnamed protein product [Paramecium primaurelia]
MKCSSNINEQSCTYALLQFQSTQYQLCRWNNSLGPQGVCENAYSALLQTSQICLNKTGNIFRWITNNESAGKCVSYGAIQLSFNCLRSGTSNCQELNSCSLLTITNQSEMSLVSCAQNKNQIII